MCALVYSEEKSPTKVEKKFTFFPAKKKVRLNPLRSGVKRSRKMFFLAPYNVIENILFIHRKSLIASNQIQIYV